MNKYKLYFNTFKYMKTQQFSYRIFYVLRAKYRKITKFSYEKTRVAQTNELGFCKSIYSYQGYIQNNEFSFLNISHNFQDKVDWNILEYGKLWVYNLNYFEYLNQENIKVENGLDLINDFIDNIESNRQGLDPFPNSLRGINWIKFLTTHSIKDRKVDDCLYAQYYILLDTLEYHLLGNHLLENGFSLLFGAYYFNDEVLYKKAKEILIAELDEEILKDGAHYELSPMYHQLMLFRVMDCLNLVSNNTLYEKELEEILRQKATVMMSWLKKMSYKDGDIPHFNDSANDIAPRSKMLFEYAQRLGIEDIDLSLEDSGYRVFNGDRYELRVDAGEIGPLYIPGHAHSDTFNFELRVDGKPCIVDTGISTYESNDRRLLERKTLSHNTVEVVGKDQSQVWSSFRVANRAHIVDFESDDSFVRASHDGYKDIGIKHQRTFSVENGSISIEDLLISDTSEVGDSYAYIHFHPDIDNIELEDNRLVIKDTIFSLKGSKKIQLDDFMFASGFNKLIKAKVLKITFEDKLFVSISFI